MSTRGTIGIKSKGRTLRVYNHSDSYPSWLGIRVAGFARQLHDQAALEKVRVKFEKLVLVNENEEPDEDTRAKVKNLGLWQDVSSGKDWYSLLRSAQGDVENYLHVGYWPEWKHGASEEWDYLIDLDEQVFTVSEGRDVVARYRFAEIPDDRAISALEGE